MYRILYYMAGKGTFAIALHVLVYPSKAITMRQFWAAWQFAEIHMIRSRYVRSQQSFTYYTITHTHTHHRIGVYGMMEQFEYVCGVWTLLFFKTSKWMDGWMLLLYYVRTNAISSTKCTREMFSSVCLVAETGFWCMIVCFLFIWPYNLCVSAIAFYSLRLCFTIAGFSDCVCGVDIALYRFNCTLCTHEKTKTKPTTLHLVNFEKKTDARRGKQKQRQTSLMRSLSLFLGIFCIAR